MSSTWHEQPIFLYGTLKQGQPNHYILQAAIDQSKAIFLGQATTVDCWPLIIYSDANVPYLLDSKGIGKQVVGDLYSVDLDILRQLDELEAHPSWYTRDALLVSLNSSPAKQISCEVYFMHDFRKELLTLQTLHSDYQDGPEHRYVFLKDRPSGGFIDIKEPTNCSRKL